jgi:hypothetical protein
MPDEVPQVSFAPVASKMEKLGRLIDEVIAKLPCNSTFSFVVLPDVKAFKAALMIEAAFVPEARVVPSALLAVYVPPELVMVNLADMAPSLTLVIGFALASFDAPLSPAEFKAVTL